MNNIEKYNIKYLNLSDFGFSFRSINKVLSLKISEEITNEDFFKILGYTPAVFKLVESIDKIDFSYYSLYCLTYFGINFITIEKLKKSFNSITVLAENINNLKSLGYQDRTIEKISEAVKELDLQFCNNIEDYIYNIIKEYEPIQSDKLKYNILNKYSNISLETFTDIINELISEHKIVITLDGYKTQLISIEDYFKENLSDKNSILFTRINGTSAKDIADSYGISRQRVQQKLMKQISKCPKFKDEDKYISLLNEYYFSKEDIKLIGLNQLLINYIDLKNKFYPSKNIVDYIIENNLINEPFAQIVFINKKIVTIGNEKVERDFVHLFTKFISINNFHSFNLELIKEQFNNFLLTYNVKEKECCINDDLVEKSRKVSNLNCFINVKKYDFIVYNKDLISYDFLKETKNYLNFFKGYGSVELFYKKNKHLCNNNFITNCDELFALLKRLYSEEFNNKIIFERTPFILENGIDKNEFIENILLEMNLPCTVQDYIKKISEETGLQKNTINSSFYNIFAKYKNSTGLLSLETEYTEEEAEIFQNLLADKDCIGTDLFKIALENKFKERSKIFLNTNLFRKFGYIYTNTTIFKDKYASRKDAVKDALSKMNCIIYSSDIYPITNIEYLTYKMYDGIDDCFIIKLGNNDFEEEKFLNVVARSQEKLFSNLKSDLIKCCEKNNIYVLDNFINSHIFKNLLKDNEDYNCILNTFNCEKIIMYLLSTSREISCLQSGNAFVFSLEDLSMKRIVEEILIEHNAISKSDFYEILYSDYGIEKHFTNAEFTNFGFYCPYLSEKIYLNQKIYEIDMGGILNESVELKY